VGGPAGGASARRGSGSSRARVPARAGRGATGAGASPRRRRRRSRPPPQLGQRAGIEAIGLRARVGGCRDMRAGSRHDLQVTPQDWAADAPHSGARRSDRRRTTHSTAIPPGAGSRPPYIWMRASPLGRPRRLPRTTRGRLLRRRSARVLCGGSAYRKPLRTGHRAERRRDSSFCRAFGEGDASFGFLEPNLWGQGRRTRFQGLFARQKSAAMEFSGELLARNGGVRWQLPTAACSRGLQRAPDDGSRIRGAREDNLLASRSSRPSGLVFRGWLDVAADAIVGAGPSAAPSDAFGHALAFETWRSLVRTKGCPRRRR
jgi:hypothetical protein